MKLVKAQFWGKEMVLVASMNAGGDFIVRGYKTGSETVWLAESHSQDGDGYIGFNTLLEKDEVLEVLGDF